MRDPRLRLAATLLTLHFLGQTVLGFELSIAQILVAMLTCAVIEVGLTLWRSHLLSWPASALLTGSGVAFILRVNGTQHGDWWSLNGWYIFAATAAIALLSKYVIRVGGRPLFNPSNIGLVLCFLIVGTQVVNPLDFWWGPLSPALIAAIVIIGIGAVVVTTRLGLIAISLAFWVTFAASLAVVAARGHCMSARWSVVPVCGRSFWWVLVTSPEILLFMFFMITDPKTIPTGRSARIAYGILVGFLTALLVAPQTTEFASKVAVLGGLVIVCGMRPLLDRLLPAARSEAARSRGPMVRGAQIGALGALAVLALAFAGIPARDPIAGSTPVAAESAAERPPVDVPDDQVPPVAIDSSVGGIAGSLSTETAATMGRELIEDLKIEADAARAKDPAVAKSAVSGKRLASWQKALDAGGADLATIASSTYQFQNLTAVVVRTPGNPQAPPLVGLHALGSVVRDGRSEPVDTTFTMVKVGDHYLIADAAPSAPT